MKADKIFFSTRIMLIFGCLLFGTAALYAQREGYKRNSRPGQIVERIPHRYTTIQHSGINFYFDNGIYFKRHKANYIVVRPPVGLRIRYLPDGYSTIHFGRVPYYFYYGVFYSYDSAAGDYVIVNAPPKSQQSGAAGLDKVTLIDGNFLEGVILKEDEEILQIEIKGKIRDIPLKKIISIEYAENTDGKN